MGPRLSQSETGLLEEPAVRDGDAQAAYRRRSAGLGPGAR